MFILNEFYLRMNIATIRDKLTRIGFLIPFRIHLLLLVIAIVLAQQWLIRNNALPETSRTAIIKVFISVTFWFTLAVLVISFLSAFVPWVLFLLNVKNKRSMLKLKTPGQDVTNHQNILIDISNIFKPLFGYIRLRLLYDGQHVSPKFTPVISGNDDYFFAKHTKGSYNWPLQNIREYDVHSGIIYFEDFFQFFSFSLALPANDNFVTHPPQKYQKTLMVQPKKTEDTSMRIDEIRKVEGEFLNYKNFENNDDVRRIVWKIYAKNKELVVRIPETNDPYASHIYFYASFYDSISNNIYDEFNAMFLDSFKTIIWNVYEQLFKQHASLQYIPDQETKTFYADDTIQKVRYVISTSVWQNQNDLVNYFNRQYGSLLCISSLTDAKQLREILDRSGNGLTIIFAELSKSFGKVRIVNWLQWLFIKPENKSTEKLQLAFNLTPLRKKILENEKIIKEMLNKSESKVLMMGS